MNAIHKLARKVVRRAFYSATMRAPRMAMFMGDQHNRAYLREHYPVRGRLILTLTYLGRKLKI